MVGWQRHVQSVIRHVRKRAQHAYTLSPNFSSSSSSSRFESLVPHSQCQTHLQLPCLHRLWRPSSIISKPYHHFQHLGISSSRNPLADSAGEAQAPLSASDSGVNEEDNHKPVSKPSQVQFVLKGINQSLNKVNLVAKLVRGIPVKDALAQLQVTDKQAAKTVYQAIHSARADAIYNHGLDPDRLLVGGAFVGKGFLGFHKKRLSYHGKGNGIKVRPKYQLTVMVREIAPEEEAEIARQRASNFIYLTKRLRLTKQENKFVPQRLIRDHKGKASNSEPTGMAS